MIVTGIEEESKSRCRIYIDNEFAFVLYKGELRLYHIRLNEEVQRDDYETIQREVLPKRVKLRAMNLLTKRDYTEAKLREKLLQGGYTQELVDLALEYVISFHYVDDLRYAVSYINEKSSSRSRQRIRQDLCQRGISQDVVQKAFWEWEDRGGESDEDGMIRKLLEKRHYSFASADSKEMQKQFAFLMRKGFSQDAIKRALYDRSEANTYLT